jgi:hypothetical protein
VSEAVARSAAREPSLGGASRGRAAHQPSAPASIAAMSSVIERLLSLLTPPRRQHRRNISALAARLGTTTDDAAWIYARSRAVGHGAAMVEYQAMCAERESRH